MKARWLRRARGIGLCVAAVCLIAAPGLGKDPPVAADAVKPQLVAQLGHAPDVWAVAFSPDGKHVATGSGDRTALLWETDTGRELRRFRGHTLLVRSVAFSPDGRHLLTGSEDKTARLWNVRTGQEVRRFDGHTHVVKTAVFSPDGKHVFTASLDKTVRQWVVASGQEVQRWEGEHEFGALALSPDGTRCVTCWQPRKHVADHSVTLWDTATGKVVRTLEGHTGGVNAVAFSADGARILTGSSDKTARSWDARTGKELRTFEGHAAGVSAVAFASTGLVLTGGYDNTARLWGAETGAESRRFLGHTMFITALAVSPDATLLVTGSMRRFGGDPIVRLWRISTGEQVRPLDGFATIISGAAFSPDGTRALLTDWEGTCRPWDFGTGRHGRQLLPAHEMHLGAFPDAAFSDDGRWALVVTRKDALLRVWNPETGQEAARLKLEFPSGMRRSRIRASFVSGTNHVIACMKHHALRWDPEQQRELWRLAFDVPEYAPFVTSAVSSPDGRYVVTGSHTHVQHKTQRVPDSSDHVARLWDPTTGKVVRSFEGHDKRVSWVAFSPDGTTVLTGGGTTARLFATESGKELRRFPHKRDVIFVDFIANGTRIITVSRDRAVRIWDAKTGEELQHSLTEVGPASAVAFTPDGTRALIAYNDCTSALRDVATGRKLCTLLHFRDGTWAVIDPEGRYDASNGGDVDGLHWVVGMEVIALDQLKARYYEPGLLAKLTGHNKEPLRKVAAFTAPKLYPEVEVAQKDGRCTIRLANRGGGIGRVVIQVNGKERTADARGPSPDPEAETLTLVEDLRDDPRLLPGEPNRIEVFAYNAEGYLRSRGFVLDYEAPGTKAPPALWAVIAGVSDYRGDKLDLRFAAKDAADFHAALKTASTELFGPEHTHITLLPNAPRDELLAALTRAREAKAGDILVVYLAGHGVSRGETFHYLTAEAASTDLSDPVQRESTTITSAELVEAIKQIPALKQVLILDTCASGGFVEALTGKRAVPSSRIRALERVKDRTGMFVLAGCASDKVSFEATRYAQGLLTYSLLLGMKGGQLRENEYVDVSSLFNFAADRVPQLAHDIGGVQRPIVAAPRGGASFDIGRLTEEGKAQVPLATVRPMFSRCAFQDFEEGMDVLDLGLSLNKLLSDETARGRDAKLVFVDVPRFPGAYKISGNYTSKDGTTKVRFKLFRDKQAATDWIEVAGAAEGLPARILAAARDNIAATK